MLFSWNSSEFFFSSKFCAKKSSFQLSRTFMAGHVFVVQGSNPTTTFWIWLSSWYHRKPHKPKLWCRRISNARSWLSNLVSKRGPSWRLLPLEEIRIHFWWRTSMHSFAWRCSHRSQHLKPTSLSLSLSSLLSPQNQHWLELQIQQLKLFYSTCRTNRLRTEWLGTSRDWHFRWASWSTLLGWDLLAQLVQSLFFIWLIYLFIFNFFNFSCTWTEFRIQRGPLNKWTYFFIAHFLFTSVHFTSFHFTSRARFLFASPFLAQAKVEVDTFLETCWVKFSNHCTNLRPNILRMWCWWLRAQICTQQPKQPAKINWNLETDLRLPWLTVKYFTLPTFFFLVSLRSVFVGDSLDFTRSLHQRENNSCEKSTDWKLWRLKETLHFLLELVVVWVQGCLLGPSCFRCWHKRQSYLKQKCRFSFLTTIVKWQPKPKKKKKLFIVVRVS